MPTQLRRINLTVPDDMYADIKQYASENGIHANAVACMSLVQRALASYKEGQFHDILVIEKVAREYDRLCEQYSTLEQRYIGLYSLYSDILVRLRELGMR